MRAITLREYAPTRAWFFTLNPSSKLQVVCRAGWRGERRRGAVRRTATGSVTPGMACGDRPVKRIPEPGACPTAGIHQWPGVKGAGPFAPLPPPPTAGWQIAQADQGGTGQAKISNHRSRPEQTHPDPPLGKKGEGAKQQHCEPLANGASANRDCRRG